MSSTLSRFFNWGSSAETSGGYLTGSQQLPEIYPMPFGAEEFVKLDVTAVYVKILTDVVNRTSGIPEKYEPALWDNCLKSESQRGLISYLAYAMEQKADLFLVYREGVIRQADQAEQQQIREDYARLAKSSVGIYVSFKNYQKTDVLKLYAAMEYKVLTSLDKTMSLAKAVQVKIDSLRSTVALIDSSIAASQALDIANNLKAGRDVMLDGKDMIETSELDMTPTKEATLFIDGKRAHYLGFPLSYINGQLSTGIGSTGEADTLGVEQGLEPYFISIIKPVLAAMFGIQAKFKSKNFRMLEVALNTLRTFELVSDNYLTLDSKRQIISEVFGIDEEDMPTEPLAIEPAQQSPDNGQQGNADQNRQSQA